MATPASNAARDGDDGGGGGGADRVDSRCGGGVRAGAGRSRSASASGNGSGSGSGEGSRSGGSSSGGGADDADEKSGAEGSHGNSASPAAPQVHKRHKDSANGAQTPPLPRASAGAHNERETAVTREGSRLKGGGEKGEKSERAERAERGERGERVAAGKGASEKAGSAEMAEVPRFLLSLSRSEKEDDFWAIKGGKLPQRPKKRSKLVEKGLQRLLPGAWLTGVSRERYEVRERKCTKKKPRGLKAMNGAESDSD
ncbi:unnamed protein product [Closterium sp. Yama58-4]|nr:unnamed protein product [Closterium sp. Yama58-4]